MSDNQDDNVPEHNVVTPSTGTGSSSMIATPSTATGSSSSSNNTNSSSITARVLLQQCLSAVLQTKPATESTPTENVEVGRGLVVYVCFMVGATMETVQKMVKSILNVRLSETMEGGKYVSILDLPGDVMIVPQATLGGRVKGKMMQYHSNIDKTVGEQLYTEFVRLVKEGVEKTVPDGTDTSATTPRRKCRTKCGTYGNRQVLKMETNGPYSHFIEY